MSFYPVLRVNEFTGFTTVHNFSPNSWELMKQEKARIYCSWSDGVLWHHKYLGDLAYGQSQKIDSNDLPGDDSIHVLSLGVDDLSATSANLPQRVFSRTARPNWRATIGLQGKRGLTSYQGEIDPLPPTASFLSIPPFLQLQDYVSNTMILVNLERSPEFRPCVLEVFDSKSNKQLGSVEVFSNRVNVFSLDQFEMDSDALPVITCKTLAGVPLYFSYEKDGSRLSLEHTHAPASHVVHGNRWCAQGVIKGNWFRRLHSE